MPGMYHIYCVTCDLWAPHRFVGEEAARQALKTRLNSVGGDPWFRPHARHVLTLWHYTEECERVVGRSVPACLDPLCYCGQDKLWHFGKTFHLWSDFRERSLPLHRTEAGWPRCATCDGGGCPDCTDLAIER